MKYLLGKSSSMFVISGGIKIAAAIVLCLWPVEDFTPLIYLFGIPAIIQGSAHIISAVYRRTMFGYWWVLFVLGVVYLTAGVIIISYPDVTPVFLMIAIGITWSLAGTIMILMSIQLNKESQKEVGLLSSGIFSVVAGVYLVTNLHRDVYSVLWMIVIYSFLVGILTIIFGVKAKSWHLYFDDNIE